MHQAELLVYYYTTRKKQLCVTWVTTVKEKLPLLYVCGGSYNRFVQPLCVIPILFLNSQTKFEIFLHKRKNEWIFNGFCDSYMTSSMFLLNSKERSNFSLLAIYSFQSASLWNPHIFALHVLLKPCFSPQF